MTDVIGTNVSISTSRTLLLLKRITHDRKLSFLLGRLVLLVLVAAFAPVLSPYDSAAAVAETPDMPIGSRG
jgi:hypothetical protein